MCKVHELHESCPRTICQKKSKLQLDEHAYVTVFYCVQAARTQSSSVGMDSVSQNISAATQNMTVLMVQMREWTVVSKHNFCRCFVLLYQQIICPALMPAVLVSLLINHQEFEKIVYCNISILRFSHMTYYKINTISLILILKMVSRNALWITSYWYTVQ